MLFRALNASFNPLNTAPSPGMFEIGFTSNFFGGIILGQE